MDKEIFEQALRNNLQDYTIQQRVRRANRNFFIAMLCLVVCGVLIGRGIYQNNYSAIAGWAGVVFLIALRMIENKLEAMWP